MYVRTYMCTYTYKSTYTVNHIEMHRFTNTVSRTSTREAVESLNVIRLKGF